MLDISVVIPTYNRIINLMDTITSLTTQSYPFEKFEVIVIDDGSTDETRDVLYSRHFPFSFQYKYQENKGSSVARNNGALVARGLLLVFLDDDMLLGKNYLQGLVDLPSHVCGLQHL